MPKLNIPLLREVQKQILAEPKSFMMHAWVIRSGPNYRGDADSNGDSPTVEMPACGTAACIGGWALLLHHNNNTNYVTGEIRDNAAALLGLDAVQASHLFNYTRWDSDLYKAYVTPGTTLECRAKIACEQIDRVIDSYEESERLKENTEVPA